MMNLVSNFLSYITSPIYSLISTPTWFFRTPGKFFGLSIPWRVSIFFGFSLTLMISTLILLQRYEFFGKDHYFAFQAEPFKFTLLMIFLVLAASTVTGLATHFWLMDIPSRYPEIDRAWNNGVTELRSFGIELSDHPLFLVLGIPDLASASALMRASKMTPGMQPKSEKPQPLYWFSAEKDGDISIFLFLTTCCQTSQMSGGRGIEVEKAAASRPPNGGTVKALGTYQGADATGDFGAINSIGGGNEPDPMASDGDLDSNIVPAQHSFASFDDGPSRQGGGGGGRSPMNTLNNDDDDDGGGSPAMAPAASGGAGTQSLSAKQADRAKEELNYVCRRLKAARQPFCPFNGAILTVPFQMLKADGDKQGSNLGQATRTDLTILTTELGVRTHVVSMVHGMETDDDFKVFVKRMREFDSAAEVDRRIGKGLSPWSMINSETIEGVGSCACDAFQKLIYKYFSITNSLRKLDNGEMYRFLAKIRGKIDRNLNRWLVEGFAPKQDEDGRPLNANEWPQLAGCYFIAAQPQSPDSGEDEGLNAHVPGVFLRLNELEGEIEWTPSALKSDKSYRDAARGLAVLIMLGIIAIVIVIYLMIRGTKPI